MRRSLFSYVAVLAGLMMVCEASASQKVCGLKSGGNLAKLEESIVHYQSVVSEGVSTALAGLEHFPELQGFLRKTNARKVCASGIIVGRNSYQYNQALIVLEVESGSGESFITPLIIQTASVQAYENTGRRPWVGFERSELQRELQGEIASVTLNDKWNEENRVIDADFSPLVYSERVLGSRTEPQTRSYVHVPGVQDGWETYIITGLRSVGGTGVFNSQYALDAGVVQVDESRGRVRFAPLGGFFSTVQNLIRYQESRNPGTAGASALDRLVEISR